MNYFELQFSPIIKEERYIFIRGQLTKIALVLDIFDEDAFISRWYAGEWVTINEFPTFNFTEYCSNENV